MIRTPGPLSQRVVQALLNSRPLSSLKAGQSSLVRGPNGAFYWTTAGSLYGFQSRYPSAEELEVIFDLLDCGELIEILDTLPLGDGRFGRRLTHADCVLPGEKSVIQDPSYPRWMRIVCSLSGLPGHADISPSLWEMMAPESPSRYLWSNYRGGGSYQWSFLDSALDTVVASYLLHGALIHRRWELLRKTHTGHLFRQIVLRPACSPTCRTATGGGDVT